MRPTIAIACWCIFSACIRTSNPEKDPYTSDPGAGGEPFRRRQIVDAGPTGPGTFRFTVSGEDYARRPYLFPPARAGDPVFVDGWEVQIDHLIVTINKISLWENPDKSASDPTQVDAKIAEVTGPWMVDLRLPGRAIADGGTPDGGTLDGGVMDLPIILATLGDQTLAGHRPFDPSKRYAISFEIASSGSAQLINLDREGESEVPAINTNRYAVYYMGQATWRGTVDSCTSTDPSFDASRVPRQVTFKMGFKTPTTYMNCQNPDLPGPGIGSEAHPRGVKVSSDAPAVVQLTVRADQPFGENYPRADSPLHFDQFAVAARRLFSLSAIYRLEERVGDGGVVNQNYTEFAIPWRWCRGDLTGYQPPDQRPRMGFEPRDLYRPDLTGQLSSDAGYRDYYDLVSHIQSGQGYLGARGRCAVQRQFPSPP